jgi:LysM repeat protein
MKNYSLKRILLSLYLILWSYALLAIHHSPVDSVGTEKRGSKNYILHKVESKETLYSISRKYGVAVPVIKDANPEIKSGLNVGQIVKIPYKAREIKNVVSSGKTHTVAPKETLFSISKKYGVTIDELKKANPELSAGLKTGQDLVVPAKGSEKVSVSKNKEKEEPAESKKSDARPAAKTEVKDTKKSVPDVDVNDDKDEKKESKKEDKRDVKSLSISPIAPPVSTSYKKVNETGFADLMTDSPTDLKYLALHKTAPAGTIIQVRNDENNQKIFVRVTGKFQSASGDKIILKMSPKALERLGAKGNKIPVSISYIP